VECCSLLANIVLKTSISHAWFWKYVPKHGYMVKRVYKMLPDEEQHVHPPFTDIVWNKAVPLKISLFVWRLLNKRISRTINFVYRGVLHSRTLDYFRSCVKQETVNHLFVECNLFGCEWSSILH
jgi:hypothetical protein